MRLDTGRERRGTRQQAQGGWRPRLDRAITVPNVGRGIGTLESGWSRASGKGEGKAALTLTES